MTEQLVDVSNCNKTVLHTFPITIGDLAGGVTPKDGDYERKALEAAAHAQLAPDADLEHLTSRMHVSRSGPLETNVMSETKQGLDQTIRERAYLLWEMEGRPHERADECGHRAHEQYLRERACVLWRQQGAPVGRADEIWHQTQEFES